MIIDQKIRDSMMNQITHKKPNNTLLHVIIQNYGLNLINGVFIEDL